jgi:hypothetical protein
MGRPILSPNPGVMVHALLSEVTYRSFVRHDRNDMASVP